MSRIFPVQEEDGRNFQEQMEGLGVQCVDTSEKKELTDVVWMDNRKGTFDLSVNNSCIYFSPRGINRLGNPERIRVGVGKVDGETVLLLKEDERKGYVFSRSGNKCQLGSKKMLAELRELGLKQGHYQLRKAKGGFIAVKEDKQ